MGSKNDSKRLTNQKRLKSRFGFFGNNKVDV